MESSTFTLRPTEIIELFVYRWVPRSGPKAVVQIAHGLAEHAGRYRRLAEALAAAGYAVYANDHRGHGRTASTPDELGWFAEHGGWDKCVEDLWQLNDCIARDHPGLPIVLLGHSMGAFMAQQLIAEHGESLAGVVLSGSGGKPPTRMWGRGAIARFERLRRGPRGKSELLTRLVFGAFNKHFLPARTAFDWLSRDEAEVDKYIADPLCAFPLTTQLVIDVIGGIDGVARPGLQARVPAGLPVHIIAGTHDPVSAGTKTLLQLLSAYRAAGLKQVTHRFYPDARHELFNETNRAEVTRDLIAWLDALIG
jgi:alpha-beta hydrolase superfamily lysophospholipase